VGRVIARAVRLRIRLAPGVQLVDVLGSHRLDEARAQKVRDAEQSIDQRLSRNLGIAADRGLDEEGIQIVIPTFYASDSHVILLDLAVPGPGAVADVTVRYKDLVYLRNGVARDHLSLARGDDAAGPLERSVLKSLLAHDLSSTMDAAARDLDARDAGAAIDRLQSFKTLLTGLADLVPGFDSDPDLANDITMLDEYLALLKAGASQQDEQRRGLADSLRYAGRLKLLNALTLER
jgi:hypothetical protein